MARNFESERLQQATQIHNWLVLANSITALCQQPGLNRSQIVKVEHLRSDCVDPIDLRFELIIWTMGWVNDLEDARTGRGLCVEDKCVPTRN